MDDSRLLIVIGAYLVIVALIVAYVGDVVGWWNVL